MKLVCTQCSHENELERIYCHNCGTKLDRSQLPAEDPKAKKKKMRTGPSPVAIAFQKAVQVILLLILAALVAGILCIFKPPSKAPEISEEQKMNAPFLSTELEATVASPTPVSRPYAEWQINSYLRDKSKLRKGDKGSIKLTDAWVRFEPDQVTLVSRYDVFGAPMGYEEVWEISGDSVPAKPRLLSARLGRLAIPTAAATPILGPFAKVLWKRFESEMKFVKQLGAKVEKEKVTLISGRPGGV